MPAHTLNTNPVQFRGLNALLAKWNADLAAQSPPGTPWTAEQLLQELAKPLLDSLRSQGIETGGKNIRAAVDAALEAGNVSVIAAVKSALSLP